MAMKNKNKNRDTKNKNSNQKPLKKPPNKKSQKRAEKWKQLGKSPVVVKVSDSDDSSSESELVLSDNIQKLLEPYSKDQLIEFICDAAIKDTDIFNNIRSTADHDISHRKIFVHGLGWDTTRESLTSAFQSFGEIEDINVVIDKATGKAKGYGFVIFKTRTAATKALKQPQKKINNRFASCQLASIGPLPSFQNYDTTGRKIYVSNVHSDADPEKLKSFFVKFGEIESGPMGFDVLTGKSRGFALFVYKTQEGAKRVLEEPYKMFEGHQLHCQRATESKNKAVNAVQQPVQAHVPLAAVAAAQNLALFSQHPTLNPLYGGLLGNPNAGFVGGSVNPLMAGALNPVVFPYNTQVGGSSLGPVMGVGGYGASHGLDTFVGNPSLLGPYGSNVTAFPGLLSYQNANIGQQPSSGRNHAGALSGYPSQRW